MSNHIDRRSFLRRATGAGVLIAVSQLPAMAEDEQLALLASDGMLVKRPLLIDDCFVLVGFKEADWKAALG